jgi:hypothetical protein
VEFERGGEAGAATERRRRGAVVEEKHKFGTEAWRDEANNLKEAPAALIVSRPNGRVSSFYPGLQPFKSQFG